MTMQTLKLAERRLCIARLDDVCKMSLDDPFVVLMPAFCIDDVGLHLNCVEQLLAHGCMEFCCVGMMAEELHDEIDCMLESKGLLSILTTWHNDVVDASEQVGWGEWFL